MLLSKAYETLPSGGGLINYEPIIDDRREHNAFGFLMSLNILIETNGGFDYTGADRCGWMREAGFREARVEHLAGPDWQAPTPRPRLPGPDSQAPTPRPRLPGPDSQAPTPW